MTTPNVFYDKFSDVRMATLVVKHRNFQFFFVCVFFSLRMAILVVKSQTGVFRIYHTYHTYHLGFVLLSRGVRIRRWRANMKSVEAPKKALAGGGRRCAPRHVVAVSMYSGMITWLHRC